MSATFAICALYDVKVFKRFHFENNITSDFALNIELKPRTMRPRRKFSKNMRILLITHPKYKSEKSYSLIMTKVAPSMLSADFSRLGEEIKRIEVAGADWAHLDVMDGMFVPNITFGPGVIRSIRKLTKMPFDVHLMIQSPLRYVEMFADAGSDILTIHVEAEGNVKAALKKIKDLGVRSGITLNPGTPIEKLDPYLDLVDLVLIMTVEAGFGGQSFREVGLSKISHIRKYADSQNPKLEISVDGGINRDTGKRCVDAGATVLAAGSSLFVLDDMGKEIALWKKYGPNAEE